MMHRIYHNIMARPAPFEVRIYVLTLSGLCMSWRTIEISPLTMTKHNSLGTRRRPCLPGPPGSKRHPIVPKTPRIQPSSHQLHISRGFAAHVVNRCYKSRSYGGIGNTSRIRIRSGQVVRFSVVGAKASPLLDSAHLADAMLLAPAESPKAETLTSPKS